VKYPFWPTVLYDVLQSHFTFPSKSPWNINCIFSLKKCYIILIELSKCKYVYSFDPCSCRTSCVPSSPVASLPSKNSGHALLMKCDFAIVSCKKLHLQEHTTGHKTHCQLLCHMMFETRCPTNVIDISDSKCTSCEYVA